MTDINLIKRNEQPTPLTHAQVDSNWQTIEDAVNELNDIKLEDAPNDGKQYARENQSWSEVVMPNIDTSLFPNGFEMITSTRNFLPTDAGKLLVLLSDAVGLKLPNSIVWNEEVNFGVLSVAQLNYFQIVYQAPDGDPNDMPMYRGNCVVLPTSTGQEVREIVMCYSQLDANTSNTTNRLNLPSTGIIRVAEGEKYEHYETTTKVVQSGGIGGGSAFTDGGATNTLTFDSSKWYGTSIAPITNSSILFDITNAVSGSQAIVYHTGSSEPMYPSGTIKRGIGSYINGKTNILTFTFLKTNEILLDVDIMNPASFPEVNYWLQRGGVASGFLLNALNQFMADIQPMRSKIVRFNPLWGETFASIFVPLIVNTDGSTTPIGNPTDANVGFVEANWSFTGELALTNANYLKYISTSFNPFNVSEVGQDDICIATIVKSSNTNQGSYLFTGGGNLRASIYGNTVSSQYASFNSSSVASVPNTAVTNTRQVLFYNRTKSTEFEVHKNGVKQIVPAPSTAVEDSNLIIGNSSVLNNLFLVGGYLISKGLTGTEISLFSGAWNTLIAKIGRI
jgi:hypothetical protein